MIIDIPDQLFEELLEIGNEIETQDNRATASPYFFQIAITKKIYEMSPNSTENYDWMDPENPDDIITDITDHTYDPDRYEKIYYTTRVEYENAFLTEKGIQKHLDQNRHHYRADVGVARTYLHHAFRNPELYAIFAFLKHLTTVKKQYESYLEENNKDGQNQL